MERSLVYHLLQSPLWTLRYYSPNWQSVKPLALIVSWNFSTNLHSFRSRTLMVPYDPRMKNCSRYFAYAWVQQWPFQYNNHWNHEHDARDQRYGTIGRSLMGRHPTHLFRTSGWGWTLGGRYHFRPAISVYKNVCISDRRLSMIYDRMIDHSNVQTSDKDLIEF